MLRNSRYRLQCNSPIRRDSSRDPIIPTSPPLVDCSRGYPELLGQLRTRPSNLDCFGYRIGVFHVTQFGTDSSDCQDTDSSVGLHHAYSMDNDKKAFGKRLVRALEAQEQRIGIVRTTIERKRYLCSVTGIGERQAGNYLHGEKLPEPDGLMALAKDLGVSWEWLAIGTGDMLPLDLTPDEAALLRALSPAERARLFQVGQVLFADDPQSRAA